MVDEPENHTLRLLREMRDQLIGWREENLRLHAETREENLRMHAETRAETRELIAAVREENLRMHVETREQLALVIENNRRYGQDRERHGRGGDGDERPHGDHGRPPQHRGRPSGPHRETHRASQGLSKHSWLAHRMPGRPATGRERRSRLSVLNAELPGRGMPLANLTRCGPHKGGTPLSPYQPNHVTLRTVRQASAGRHIRMACPDTRCSSC